jgi:hypothetical protein
MIALLKIERADNFGITGLKESAGLALAGSSCGFS